MQRDKTPPQIAKHLPLKKCFTFLALAFISLFHHGCSSFNCTPLQNILGANTDLIQFSYTIADHLAERAMPPLVPLHPEMPILVTTFVDANDLEKTSEFGRVLQEQVASRLVQLGYTVREMKLTNTLSIKPKSGETMLSRDLTKISSEQQAQAIVVGTVLMANQTLYISTRLINPVNKNILATDDYQLCMDDNILAMFGLRHQNASEQPISEPRPPLLNTIL
jgi:TolB-like protein